MTGGRGPAVLAGRRVAWGVGGARTSAPSPCLPSLPFCCCMAQGREVSQEEAQQDGARAEAREEAEGRQPNQGRQLQADRSPMQDRVSFQVEEAHQEAGAKACSVC